MGDHSHDFKFDRHARKSLLDLVDKRCLIKLEMATGDYVYSKQLSKTEHTAKSINRELSNLDKSLANAYGCLKSLSQESCLVLTEPLFSKGKEPDLISKTRLYIRMTERLIEEAKRKVTKKMGWLQELSKRNLALRVARILNVHGYELTTHKSETYVVMLAYLMQASKHLGSNDKRSIKEAQDIAREIIPLL